MGKKAKALCSSILRAFALSAPTLSREASTAVDFREEYAEAFRTESYNEFWARVLDLTDVNASPRTSSESTAAARLPSYRLFVEHLLDPDQSSVNKILYSNQAHNYFKNQKLLVDYFSQTANASFLCGFILKEIDQTRSSLRPFRAALRSFTYQSCRTKMATELAAFATATKYFGSSSGTTTSLQTGCNILLKELESSRSKADAELRRVRAYKCSLAVLLVAVTASTAIAGVVLAAHALVLFAVVPMFSGRDWWWSFNKRRRVLRQLDAAAKGTYILSRDLDTITRLVARLDNELEHARGMMKFYSEKCDEFVRQLKKIEVDITQRLDELEEHLYLCFMTINRTRSLVMKEIIK